MSASDINSFVIGLLLLRDFLIEWHLDLGENQLVRHLGLESVLMGRSVLVGVDASVRQSDNLTKLFLKQRKSSLNFMYSLSPHQNNRRLFLHEFSYE